MKNIKLSFLAITGILFLNTSCDKEDDYPITGNLPVATFTSDKTSVVEFDDPLTADYENVAICHLTLDKPYKTNIKYKIELVAEGTTGSVADFKFNLAASGIDNGPDGYLLTVDQNTTDKVFTFTANFDDDVEGVETFRFKISPIADLNGTIAPNSQYFTISVGNSVSDNLNVYFDWETTKEYKGLDGEMHSYADFDFDLEIYNSGFNVTNSSYSSAPEKVQFSASSPDGMYFIVPSFYDSSSAETPMLPIEFHPTLKIVKKGVFVKEIDMSGIWNTTVGGDQQGNPDAYQLPAYFIKSGTTYSIYDADDNLLAQGKAANLATVLNNANRKK